MFLTGRPDGPGLGGPVALIELVETAAAVLSRHGGRRPPIDGLALLGERAAIASLGRRGDVSCGGGARLLRAADGWLAASLPRLDDEAAVSAWLEEDVPAGDPWPAVEASVARRAVAELDARAALLGLPIAAVSSVGAPDESFGLPIPALPFGPGEGPSALSGTTVVDLSALWAGPLCGQLLGECGARVIKVESTSRPDGARAGPPAFFDLLNGGKESVVLDLQSSVGRGDLRRLLMTADIVIESNRPRALEQMGIVAGDLLSASSGPRVWVSITSHGRSMGERVGFGDVAAAAGGLVVFDAAGACFVADAVADPLTGLVAAAAVSEALAAGGRWLLDAGMAPLAASVAGAPLDVSQLQAQPPQTRVSARPAAELGTGTAAMLADLATGSAASGIPGS
ncbi:MAG TPA: CoA transferase [Acidimicrobiales bacterium]|jgi:hypothetical protein|nr:CoA transferase [Acidimicrobiales bacterium]